MKKQGINGTYFTDLILKYFFPFSCHKSTCNRAIITSKIFLWLAH